MKHFQKLFFNAYIFDGRTSAPNLDALSLIQHEIFITPFQKMTIGENWYLK